MHELSIADEIVKLALEHAPGARVLSLTVEIGDLAGVEPEALSFCYESLVAGTLAEGSRLIIRRLAGQATCRSCRATFVMPRLHEPCPECGGHDREILQGRELSVKEMEVEDHVHDLRL